MCNNIWFEYIDLFLERDNIRVYYFYMFVLNTGETEGVIRYTVVPYPVPVAALSGCRCVTFGQKFSKGRYSLKNISIDQIFFYRFKHSN